MKPQRHTYGNRKSRLRRWLGLEKFEHRFLMAGPNLESAAMGEDAVGDSNSASVGSDVSNVASDVSVEMPGEGTFNNIGLGSPLSIPNALSPDSGYLSDSGYLHDSGYLPDSGYLSDDYPLAIPFDSPSSSARIHSSTSVQNPSDDFNSGGFSSNLGGEELGLLLPQPTPSLPPINEIPEPWPIDPEFGSIHTTEPGLDVFSPEGSAPDESEIGRGPIDAPGLGEAGPKNPIASQNEVSETGARDNRFQLSLAASVTVEPYVKRTAEDSEGIYTIYPGSDVRGEGESIRLVEGSKLYAAQRQDVVIASVYRQRSLTNDANPMETIEASDAQSPTPMLQGSPSMLVFQWSSPFDEDPSLHANDSVFDDSARWLPPSEKPSGSANSAIAMNTDVPVSDVKLLQESDVSAHWSLIARLRQTISGPTVLVALGALVHTWYFGSQFDENRPGYETERLPPKRKRKPF